MLEEQVVIDRIEVLEDGTIQVRTATRILKNGVRIAHTYHRHCLSPGDDLSTQDAKVQAIAGVVHTPEVISAFMSAKNEII